MVLNYSDASPEMIFFKSLDRFLDVLIASYRF